MNTFDDKTKRKRKKINYKQTKLIETNFFTINTWLIPVIMMMILVDNGHTLPPDTGCGSLDLINQKKKCFSFFFDHSNWWLFQIVVNKPETHTFYNCFNLSLIIITFLVEGKNKIKLGVLSGGAESVGVLVIHMN